MEREYRREDGDAYISSQEAAEIIGISTACLNWWARSDEGPNFYRKDDRIFYRRDEILAMGYNARELDEASAAALLGNKSALELWAMRTGGLGPFYHTRSSEYFPDAKPQIYYLVNELFDWTLNKYNFSDFE